MRVAFGAVMERRFGYCAERGERLERWLPLAAAFGVAATLWMVLGRW
jgi:hypothetical protein